MTNATPATQPDSEAVRSLAETIIAGTLEAERVLMKARRNATPAARAHIDGEIGAIEAQRQRVRAELIRFEAQIMVFRPPDPAEMARVEALIGELANLTAASILAARGLQITTELIQIWSRTRTG